MDMQDMPPISESKVCLIQFYVSTEQVNTIQGGEWREEGRDAHYGSRCFSQHG